MSVSLVKLSCSTCTWNAIIMLTLSCFALVCNSQTQKQWDGQLPAQVYRPLRVYQPAFDAAGATSRNFVIWSQTEENKKDGEQGKIVQRKFSILIILRAVFSYKWSLSTYLFLCVPSSLTHNLCVRKGVCMLAWMSVCLISAALTLWMGYEWKHAD